MHVRDDLAVRIASGREIAAGIPNARFVALPGKNHVLLEQDPGLTQYLNELKSFVSASKADEIGVTLEIEDLPPRWP